ncbi:MAG TPA: DUF1501 domain-containing protein [Verrucomicrobiae bacterium]|jgi:hypothetical protein
MSMDPKHILDLTRRDFLVSTARGVGGLAFASLLAGDGLLAADPKRQSAKFDPFAPKPPHFAPKAKRCIFIYMEGGVSQLDLFDPKPKLNELNGQKLPDSMTKNIRFAFLQKDSATLLGSPYKFERYGKCGTEMSALLPNIGGCADDIALVRSMHTEAFNHHPGELLMYTGFQRFGRPSVGSWVAYALGSPSQNLPGYVVLTAGRAASGGNTMFSSGFLPSAFQGVTFRNEGEPVMDLNNPPGVTAEMRHYGLDALHDLNSMRQKMVGDPEIASRIASYELAARMQLSAPELTDFSSEKAETLEAYGVNRDPGKFTKTYRGGGVGTFKTFARNCLMARRLVERGVRFVSIHHASWDHHNDLPQDLPFNCAVVDQPVGALLKDLKQRGLLDDTLVVWASEFGRTPLGENRKSFSSVTGRDHHPFAFSVWMAGGGVHGGQVIGETDELGWGITKDPVHVNDFHASILHLFGLDHEKLTYRFQGRDFRLTDVAGKVVKQLV